ncbi:hypothetical protein ACIPEN_21730 [Herbaspirillum chlorophenolicum]|uniref:Uncharacterized protein n=1 Tax=Herbaspirillum chlorophenolicum TaxID=211589 RepID=A0ABW8F5N1_9BURK
MVNDTGSWLSAEQAVMPDGTERENLPLVKKKLPALSQSAGNDDAGLHALPTGQASLIPSPSS